MCPVSGLKGGLGLWFPLYHPESTIARRALALTLCEHVRLSTPPYTCTLCLLFSLNPSVIGLANSCTCWRKDTITRSCVLAYLCHMIAEDSSFVFLSFLYIKLYELGVEVEINNRSAVTHHKFNLLKFPLRSSCSERTNNAFLLLICFCSLYL